MASTTAPHPRHHADFHTFDARVERMLGADMRVIYGMGVPILVIVGLVILLALHPHSWLRAVIVAIEVGALGLIVAGILSMLSDDEQPGDDGRRRT